MRLRAAAAVGALALNSFPVIEAELLRSWAGSPIAIDRRSAAQVLGVTIWDDRHSAASSGLLHHWARLESSPRHQWTAAIAYAGLAGLRYPQQTLDNLRRLADWTIERPQLLPPILQAITNLYATADLMPERRSLILNTLDQWSDDQGRSRVRKQRRPASRTALLAFWVLIWPERDDRVWRQVLDDIGIPGGLQDQAVSLIRRSLNFSQPRGSVGDGLHPRKMARDGIEALIVHVARGNESDQIEHLAGLLGAVMIACRRNQKNSAAELQRLHYYAAQWRVDGDAGRMLVEIMSS
jgi:hypothetical protein